MLLDWLEEHHAVHALYGPALRAPCRTSSQAGIVWVVAGKDQTPDWIEIRDHEPGDAPEGVTLTERSGAWVVRAWWPHGTRGGPHKLWVFPADDANPAKAARGISTATLNGLPLVEMTEAHAKVAPKADQAAESFRVVADDEIATRRGRSDLFYASIAAEYDQLVSSGERYPVTVIAARTNRSVDSVRGWLRVGRQRGFLSGQRNKAGGQLTDKGRAILDSAGRLAETVAVTGVAMRVEAHDLTEGGTTGHPAEGAEIPAGRDDDR